jgi:DNA invertase Pin-like site-specific DNA recombinase
MLLATAQLERRLISTSTKEGLAAAKAEGMVAGPPRSHVPEDVVARVRDLVADGRTLSKIADKLNRDGVPLPSGSPGVWQATRVRRLLRED